jgi:hypothetical protein
MPAHHFDEMVKIVADALLNARSPLSIAKRLSKDGFSKLMIEQVLAKGSARAIALRKERFGS